MNSHVILKINEYHHDFLDNYHEVNKIMHSMEWKNILFLLDHYQFEWMHIVDLWTGTGFLPLLFLDNDIKFGRFSCTDISQNILDEAQKRIESHWWFSDNFEFIKLVDQQLPFETWSVDVLMMNSVLHHLPDLEKFYQEASRILKKEWLLVICHEPNCRFYKHSFLKLFHNTIYSITSWLGKIKEKLYWVSTDDPMCLYVNKKLIEDWFIKEPLSREQIYSSIDFHADTWLDFGQWSQFGFSIDNLNTSSYLCLG